PQAVSGGADKHLADVLRDRTDGPEGGAGGAGNVQRFCAGGGGGQGRPVDDLHQPVRRKRQQAARPPPEKRKPPSGSVHSRIGTEGKTLSRTAGEGGPAAQQPAGEGLPEEISQKPLIHLRPAAGATFSRSAGKGLIGIVT